MLAHSWECKVSANFLAKTNTEAEGRAAGKWTALLGRPCLTSWAILHSGHLEAFFAREAETPSGSESRWGLTVASLKLSLQQYLEGWPPSVLELREVFGDKPKFHRPGEPLLREVD